MKKLLSMLLALALILSLSSSALALNYTANIGNEATFETMAEARANAPAAMQPFYTRGKYVAHPVMDNYPGDTTYVYRSPNMYGINAAVRLNTNIVVFSDKSFADKVAAFDYLKGLGLIDIIDEAIGSVILVTPADPEKGFTAADQKNYYALQTALFSINATGVVDGENVTFVDASYYGGYGFLYVIGLDGGATFVNNYVASTFDYVSRIAGLLLVGGKMDRIREVADIVPVYMVNPDAAVVAKYEAVNGVDSLTVDGDKHIAYNQFYPVRKVLTREIADPDYAAIVKDAYYTFLIKAQRGIEITQGLYSASTPYQGSSADSAPYSLSARNAVINGKTVDGLYLFECRDERWSSITTDAGEYLQTWYEYVPEEIVKGTAKEGTIPMILALHGGGDDPRQFVDGQGFLEVAGRERILIVAPEKQELHVNATNGREYLSQTLPELVELVLDKYPEIDRSRVYVTGFSMGSLATFRASYGKPELFAAAFPQSGLRGVAPDEIDKQNFVDVDLPYMISTSEYNMRYASELGDSFIAIINEMLALNEMELVPAKSDSATYPIAGFPYDIYTQYKVNDDYVKHSWYIKNADGIPMVGATYTECITHCLYPQHAEIIWDFFKHYSRNQETGEIEYNPYVR